MADGKACRLGGRHWPLGSHALSDIERCTTGKKLPGGGGLLLPEAVPVFRPSPSSGYPSIGRAAGAHCPCSLGVEGTDVGARH